MDIRFARASSHVADFNTLNKLLTQKLLKQGYQYHKLLKTFSKIYRLYNDLILFDLNSKLDLTLWLPNATVVEFTVHCQKRLQSKFKGTVDSC